MERKIGEIFNCEGKQYKVEANVNCRSCSFYEHCGSSEFREVFGNCIPIKRSDHRAVIFKEIKTENCKEIMTKKRLEKAIEINDLIEEANILISSDAKFMVSHGLLWHGEISDYFTKKIKEFVRQEKIQLEEEFKNI